MPCAHASTSSVSQTGPARRRATGVGKSERLTYRAAVRHSLQANHSRSCALGRAWTPFDEACVGCTCPDGPVYYVVVRAGQHAHKEAVGRDRHQAEIALRRVSAAVDDGSFRPRPTIGFLEWADSWLASLERKPTTVGSYRSTIAHAKDVFGSQRVRRIAPEDIARFNGILRERGCSASTRAKHLRVLGACLQAAVSYRYADSNAVRELPSAQRPRPERKEAAYFENNELPRLFEHLRSDPVRTLCLVALKTGMRQGELFALRWADVDLEEAVIRVRSQLHGRRTQHAKEPRATRRRSHLWLGRTPFTCASTEELERTRSSCSPARTVNGFLSPTVVLRRHLYPAMTSAGDSKGRADARETDIP